ncbi:unnamed protein product [Moneuplotes crassus]|uniref:Uncharacterized protein n=3 Tax=Euplotes crassus TaxID=5936 RepID=A0AAD1XIF3_EUPCR|nr:unnamed protein product [Moneuplotes crassus]
MLHKAGLVGMPIAYFFTKPKMALCDPGSPQVPPQAPPQAQGPPKPADEQAELQKILEENPFAAADPEEMERMLQAGNKNKLPKPPQFSRLTIPIKMLTTCEALDGIRFDFSMGLSEKFQLGGTWNFSNTKPSNFSLMTMYSPNMSPVNQEGMNFINCKKDINGKMELVANYHILKDLIFKAEGFFPNDNMEASHISYEIMKEFKDFHVSAKTGGGSYSLSLMKTFNRDLFGGFEAMWHPQIRDFIFNYGFKYNTGNHTLIGQYIPIAKKDAFTLGYINRASKQLHLFSEFRGGFEGQSETALGFKLRFNTGMVTGTMNSQLKMSSSIQMMMDQMIMTMFNTSMDFQRPEKPITFGISLSIGGGM